MAYPSTPRDAQNIPIGTVYTPDGGFAALQGGDASIDSNGNKSAPVMVSGSVDAASASEGTNGDAAPETSMQIGASDGTDLQALQVESASHANLRSAIYNGANEMGVDASGNASVKLGEALPAGTNTVGNVGLVAGSALIGGVELVDGAGSNKASISSGGALKVDNSGVTQPVSGSVSVSGSVTANAGTNLNTSALALETGGNLATIAGAVSSSKMQANIASVDSSLSQANQVPVSSAAPQGKLTLSGSLTANSDNSITFSGGATVARRIRIQNESSTAVYWETDATASTASPSLAAPGTNAVSVEWIAVSCTTLHIFIPSGGTTTLNGSGGVKVTAYA